MSEVTLTEEQKQQIEELFKSNPDLRDITQKVFDDETLDDGSELRSSIGLGVEWFTPVGPLSFSFAAPITKSSTDKTETFRFNLGTTF